jgi:predicted RND superfamily exporter protein
MHAAALTADANTLASQETFDTASGSRLERLVFNHRAAVLAICLLLTLVLAGAAAWRLTLNASFDKMIPRSHPYIQNYLDNRLELRGLGNSLRVVVESPSGNVFEPRYLDALKRIHDELFSRPASTAPGRSPCGRRACAGPR